jgi:alpha-tubulin suppressor-like RCC1 family protein
MRGGERLPDVGRRRRRRERRSSNSLPVQALLGAAHVAAGFRTSCAIDALYQVECWGDNPSGVLGHAASEDPIAKCPGSTGSCNPAPNYIHDGSGAKFGDASTVAIGASAACALKKDGTVWCWGAVGYLGDGRAEVDAGSPPQLTPVQVMGLPSP